MKLRKFALSAAALTLLAVPTFAASPQKPGNWQMTIEVDMPNAPVKIPPTTFTHCVTQEDVDNPERSIPKSGRDNPNCKMSDYKIEGNKVTWTMKCEGKQPMTSEGQMTFSGDSFSGWTKVHMKDQEITSKMSGKRLGDCSK